MNTLLLYFFTTLPVLLVIGLSIAAVILAGLSLAYPRILVYPYLTVLFWVTGSSYGRLDAVAPSIYSRGSGVLFFSAILWLMLGAYLWAKLSAHFRKAPPLPCSLYPWIWAWTVLLIGNVIVGAFQGIPISESLNAMGFSNIVWMGILISLILTAFKTDSEFREFTRFILLMGLARATYGLVRWIGFGGDPANAYANRAGLNIKLTFFDINDSLVCLFALTISALMLFRPESIEKQRLWRFICWATLVTTAACIVLSFRRTAWIGLILAGPIILFQLPTKRRIQTAIVSIPLVTAGIIYAAWKRLSQTHGVHGFQDFFYDIQSKQIGAESSRLLELKLAMADFIGSPLFGLGSWGRYSGHSLISWQTGESAGGFLHSGILHIALKSGMIGLVLLAGTVGSFVIFTRRTLPLLDEKTRCIAVAGAAGAAFMIPDFIIGTPVPQLRTMQLIALSLSMPYLAAGFSRLKSTPLATTLRAKQAMAST